MAKLGSQKREFYEILCLRFIRIYVDNVEVLLKSDEYNRYFT